VLSIKRLTLALAIAAGACAIQVNPAKASEALQRTAYEAFTICVLDAQTGLPLLGARVRDANAQVVAMTDGSGTALVPARCEEDPVLSLTRTGYPMVLVEGHALKSYTLIKMKRFTPGAPALRFRLSQG
jgi:hypothetical protein